MNTIIDRIKAAGKQVKGFKASGVRTEVKITDKELTGMDSLARVEFTMAVEEEFGIQMSDEAADCIATFGDLIKVIEGNKESPEGTAVIASK